MKERTTHRRARVLFVSHEMTLGDAQLALFYLLRGLDRSSWQPVVAAPEHGRLSEMLNAEAIETVVDEMLLLDCDEISLRRIVPQFDLVVANTIASWRVINVARAAEVPVIWYVHEMQVGPQFFTAIDEARAAMNFADLIVVPTRQTSRVISGLTESPVEIVSYGIPALEQTAERRNDGVTRFVSTSSIEPRNGQDVFLDAINELPAELRQKCSFTLAGRVLDRDFNRKVRDHAGRLPNVSVLDSFADVQTAALLNQSAVVICSSRDGTMPIALIEAMTLSKALVTTDIGDVTEWIHDGLNGLVIPPGNASRLAQAIQCMVQDPVLITELGAAALRTFERHFRLEPFLTKFEALLEETAERKRPARATLTYENWIAEYDAPTARGRVAMRRQLRGLRHQPRISVILPVFDPAIEVLAAALDSVQRQSYERWELCIADDASTNPEVRHFLQRFVLNESRAKVVFRGKNGHISACSNSALALATGEWCALLDHDDALSEDALAFVALEIDRHPDAGLIYSDQDSIDHRDRRSNPFFKTEWDPLLFLAQNFINHLGVYRTPILREIGGFREGLEGSQDYDLALRSIERLRPHQIRHIPRVLYHWRMVPGSVAESSEAKPYAKDAARAAIADHLTRSHIAAHVAPCPENADFHRVIYEVPNPASLVSIIICTRDKADLLERCVQSIRERTDYRRSELVIVDNDSTEPTTHALLNRLVAEKIARVIRDPGTFNFSRLNNLAARQARGDFVCFLNNDVEASRPEWLGEMISHGTRTDVGAVGARLWYADGKLQHGGVIVGLGGIASHAYYGLPRRYPGYFNRACLHHHSSAVTAACLLMRTNLFHDLGGFDEENLAINFNDVDLCLKIRRRGLQIVWTPYADLIHHESASRGRNFTAEQVQQLIAEAKFVQQNWGPELLDDPFYSPNFSLDLPGFGLAFPPRYRHDVLQDEQLLQEN